MPHSPLLVGAFERDNFGDLLFGIVTAALFTGTVQLTAPFPGRVNHLLPGEVRAYGPLLEAVAPDLVWVAGGEVGGMFSPEMAYHLRQPTDGDPGVRKDLPLTERVKALAGTDKIEFPYLPRPTAFPDFVGAPYVVNSVGLSRLQDLSQRASAPARSALREADAVSVRDPLSSAVLTEWGIPHRLAPDVVHVLRQLCPMQTMTSNTAIIQIRARSLRDVGPARIAKVLSTLPRDLEIRLLSAGTSPGHDDPRAYEEVARDFARLHPDRKISVVKHRAPMSIVQEIVASQVFAGTSLHGRIVAATYDVPRVSLNGEKLNAYSGHWDNAMPWGVRLENLGAAIVEARNLRGAAGGTGAQLSELARENFLELLKQVESGSSGERLTRRIHSLEQFRRETMPPPYVERFEKARALLHNPRRATRGATQRIVRQARSVIKRQR